MPRRKTLPKFKYTVRKKPNNSLFVRYPNRLLKTMVWRKVEIETQEEVNKILDKLKTEIAAQTRDSGIPERCDGFFDFWLNMVKPHISERTLSLRETFIRLYLKPQLGYFNLAEVKPVQFLMMYQTMLDKKLQPPTIRKAHAIAFSIFKEAVNLELIASNPVARVRPPKTDSASEKIRVMNLEEVKRFRALCQTATNGIIFEFALETGMRPQEYLALRWSDIDLKKQIARVDRALVFRKKDGKNFYFKSPKTKGSRRTIPLSKQICGKLIEHQTAQKRYVQEIHERIRRKEKPSREYRKEHNKKMLENYKELNLVFPSQDFTPKNPLNVNARYFKSLAAEAKLDKTLTLYSLRHSCCSLLLQAGANVKTVSERLGHASAAFTLDVYGHIMPGMQEETTDIFSKLLYEGGEKEVAVN